jgi:hypothetical protein
MEIKYLIELFIFNTLISLSLSFIPNWNFSNSTEDLFSESPSQKIIIISQKNWSNDNIFIKKKLTKNAGSITEQNYFNINDGADSETNWEFIESFYKINNKFYVCPSGKNYFSFIENGKIKELKPNEFSNEQYWDLKCYLQGHKANYNFMFTVFLNTNKLYYSKLNSNHSEFIPINLNIERIYNFIWTYLGTNNEFKMVAVLLENTKFILKKIVFVINGVDVNAYIPSDDNGIVLDNQLNYIQSNIFNNEYLYWFSYNSSNFVSGFSKNKINVSNNYNDYSLYNNSAFSFNFMNDYTIKSMESIKESFYIYYEIEENSSNEQLNIYHGVFDIRNNKILFNTNETINKIKSYSLNSLLIITDKSAYKLCTYVKDTNNNCINECALGEEIILDIKSNRCGIKTENNCDNYLLKPDNICVTSCDTNFYSIENNICALCKDLDNNKPYKFYNESECLSEKPENSFYLNEKLKILKYCYNSCKTCNGENKNECTTCREGYKHKNGECKKCYEACDDCEEESTDKENQKCISCLNNKYLQRDKGNCIDNCLSGYYINNTFCEECNSSCLTCDKGFSDNSPHCTSCSENKLLKEDSEECVNECLNGYYYEDNKYCKKCHSSCLTCSQGYSNDSSHCTSCINNKYFQRDKGNCIDNCLSGYYVNNTFCEKCDPSCLTCDKGFSDNSSHCTSCPENLLFYNDTKECKNNCSISYYKLDNKCLKCDSNCKSCSKGKENDNNNCLSCDENSKFKYLVDVEGLSKNCVEICPNSTILSENKCITNSFTIWKIIFIILTILIVLAIFILIICVILPQKKNDQDLIDEVNTELKLHD